MNRRRILSAVMAFTGVYGCAMGVPPIPRLCDGRVTPSKWTLRRLFAGDSSMSCLWNRPRSPTTRLCHAYDF